MARQLPVYSPLSPRAISDAMRAAVSSGAREADALERRLADRFESDTLMLTSSGTHSLQIALALLPELAPGERVVALPGYSCYDLVTAAVGAGVRVRFYDIDPGTLSPDTDSLRKAVAEGVSGIVAGNLYGYPLDWSAIRSISNGAGVPVIEDAAQGLGTADPSGMGGSLGDLTVLSFGRGKGWTGGGGGALLARASRSTHGGEPAARAAEAEPCSPVLRGAPTGGNRPHGSRDSTSRAGPRRPPCAPPSSRSRHGSSDARRCTASPAPSRV